MWSLSFSRLICLFVAGKLWLNLWALWGIVRQFEHEGHAGSLDEHHGIRMKEAFRGITIDLQDVVVESQTSFGCLPPRSDLNKIAFESR